MNEAFIRFIPQRMRDTNTNGIWWEEFSHTHVCMYVNCSSQIEYFMNLHSVNKYYFNNAAASSLIIIDRHCSDEWWTFWRWIIIFIPTHHHSSNSTRSMTNILINFYFYIQAFQRWLKYSPSRRSFPLNSHLLTQ